MFAQSQTTIRKLIRAGRDRAALTRRDMFGRMKGKASSVTARSDVGATGLCTDCMTGILEQKAVRAKMSAAALEVGDMAGIMNHDCALGSWCDLSGQIVGIDGQRIAMDIDEDRCPAGQKNSIGCRQKTE